MSVASPPRVRSNSLAVRMPRSARRAPQGGFIEPAHPTKWRKAPSGPEWVHEVKFDGYRAQLHLRDGKPIVYTRNGLDWTEQFAPIAKAAATLAPANLILDGEAIVEDAHGVADFHALRRSLGQHRAGRLRFYAFDLLYLDGYDLRPCAFAERRRLLEAALAHAPDTLLLADQFEIAGDALFAHACRLQLEGIVSKRRDAPYHSGRVESWVKVKCKRSDTFPIIAFVEKLGARPRRIASLYVGRRVGDQLLYAGKVQTGYSEAIAHEVRERLGPLIIERSPLSVAVHKPKATWVRPDVPAEVEYSALTADGLLRAAVFKGLRDDLVLPKRGAPPLAPRTTRSGAGRRVGVPRENILQLLPDAVVPSREELVRYWKRVAPRALKFLARRPLKLVRHTHGTTFYHKGRLPPVPPSVQQLRIEKREGGRGVRLWVDSVAGLIGLVEIGAVELHPWNAHIEDIERADQLVLDLDPGEDVAWERVVEAALRMRALMRAEGLAPRPKLTGGKGLHLVAPLAQPIPHDAAHVLARRLAAALAARDPQHYITSAKASRRGRIFLDYLRNGRGTTAVGVYSPRVRAGFPIAAPVSWRQIEAGIRPDAYTMEHPLRAESHSATQPVRKRP